MEGLNFHQRLAEAQNELKAPKGQWNDFSKFNYRSAEDILEAVKPINTKHNLLLTLSDKPLAVGDRIYIEVTATITDVTDPTNQITVTAYAREAISKKGMDDSQITGAASSYARKYALNGLYLIDDTKDADTNEHHQQVQNAPQQQNYNQQNNLSTQQQNDFGSLVNEIVNRVNELAKKSGKTSQEINKAMLKRTNDETGNTDTAITKENLSIYNKHLRLAEVNFNKQQTQANQSNEQTSLMNGRSTQPVNWGQ